MTRVALALVAAIAGGAVLVAQAPTSRSAPAASPAAAVTLPLENLGLEHLDIIVPDTAASARFYARIFKAPLHQQPVRDTMRYFVVLGDVPADRQVGYIAIGAGQGRPPMIGHYCVLAKTYNREGLSRALAAAGQPSSPTAAGPIGMWPDPDGLELQLFQPPAGLVTAAVPSTLAVQADGFVAPTGVDHVLLLVSDLNRSLAYYRALYGAAAERPPDSQGRVWFHLERGTRLALQQAPTGTAPTIAHYALTVRPFDRTALEGRLGELGAKPVSSADEPGAVRFLDNNGIVVELLVK